MIIVGALHPAVPHTHSPHLPKPCANPSHYPAFGNKNSERGAGGKKRVTLKQHGILKTENENKKKNYTVQNSTKITPQKLTML